MKIFSVYTVLLMMSLTTGLQLKTVAQATDSAIVKGRWGVEGRADKISDKISREVGLNKDQYKKIYTINEDIIRRTDAIRTNTTLSKKERMQQFKALDSERSQRFKSVLTATQYKKWNDWEMRKKEHLEAKMEKKRMRKSGNN
ncbi:hypothetical protein ECE50_025085 [Chitinophaga sp. Mgbs1]|uniref:DUF4890 domain-containing protein n=1 Tax=Chitinophaga solisilvae TaxID=1233460 RepID=A0A9Q5D9M0_9BACT|nr:hypothetical protein [Chitinophaga solisilvae]